jgi:hypothetical protein
MARSESYNLKRRLARRVRRGVIFLNNMHPGWEDRIDLDRLDINQASDCICGQLEIGNMPAITNENPTDRTLEMDSGLGFFVGEDNSWGPYVKVPVLNELWKAEIKAIREAKAAKLKAEAEAAAAKAEADKNELFGTIVDGLISQKLTASVNPVSQRCVYRGPNGLKCAAGHAIPDCDYNPQWEGIGVGCGSTSVVDEYFQNRGFSVEMLNLLGLAQGAHDNCLKGGSKALWADRMLYIYSEFKINSPIHKAKLETVVALMS